MAKKSLKRKEKSKEIKEEESSVVLPLVRRSDEPVTKKVFLLHSLNTIKNTTILFTCIIFVSP